MAKKQKFELNMDILFKIAIVVVLVFIVIKLGKLNIDGAQQQQSVAPDIISRLESVNNPPGVSCSIRVDNTVLPEGVPIPYTIEDGANEICYIYYKMNNNNWVLAKQVTLLNNGRYSDSQILAAGSYYVAAICGDCVTDKVFIRVTAPVTPPSEPIDSDGDGYPDADEIGSGNNPFDPNDHPNPFGTDCNSLCVNDGYASGYSAISSCSYCMPNVCEVYGSSLCCCRVHGQQQIACSNVETIPSAQSDCDTRYGCPDTYHCYYKPSAGGRVAYCNCEPMSEHSGIRTHQSCQEFAADEGLPYSAITVGGISWTPSTCEAHAKADCEASQPVRFLNSVTFDLNCCIWSCRNACVDSPDGGIDISVFSTCRDMTYTVVDECKIGSNTQIYEMYCQDWPNYPYKLCSSKLLDCATIGKVCSAGRCI